MQPAIRRELLLPRRPTEWTKLVARFLRLSTSRALPPDPAHQVVATVPTIGAQVLWPPLRFASRGGSECSTLRRRRRIRWTTALWRPAALLGQPPGLHVHSP